MYDVMHTVWRYRILFRRTRATAAHRSSNLSPWLCSLRHCSFLWCHNSVRTHKHTPQLQPRPRPHLLPLVILIEATPTLAKFMSVDTSKYSTSVLLFPASSLYRVCVDLCVDSANVIGHLDIFFANINFRCCCFPLKVLCLSSINKTLEKALYKSVAPKTMKPLVNRERELSGEKNFNSGTVYFTYQIFRGHFTARRGEARKWVRGPCGSLGYQPRAFARASTVHAGDVGPAFIVRISV